jgi:hypothetical protein
MAAMPAHAAETTTPEGVLIIHSNQRPTPAAIIIEDKVSCLATVLARRSVTQVD